MARKASRKMRHKSRHCPTGKIRYRSQCEAQDSNRKIAFKILEDGDTPNVMRSYWCHLCAGWHLARKDPRDPCRRSEQNSDTLDRQFGRSL